MNYKVLLVFTLSALNFGTHAQNSSATSAEHANDSTPSTIVSRRFVLSQPDKWKLRLNLTTDENGTPASGNFEFSALQCGGTYTYSGRNAANEVVLQQKMEYGRCVQGCKIIIDPNYTKYREECGLQITGQGALYASNQPKILSSMTNEVQAHTAVMQTCEISGDGTFTSKNGTIWQACLYGQKWENNQCAGMPKNVTWYEAMEAAKNSNFAGNNDWILPSSAFLNGSLHPQNCNHTNVKTYVREYRHSSSLEIVGNFWTANTGSSDGGNTVEITDSSYLGGYGSLHYDTMKSASHFDKAFTKPVYAVFVRNSPNTDVENFSRALSFVQCNSACLANRKKAQQERDAASARRGDEWNGKVREFFTGGSSSGTNSSSNAGNKEYSCTFTCYSINSGVFTNKSNAKDSTTVRASDIYSAKDIVNQNLKNLCPRGSTFVGNVAWGAQDISCNTK